MLKQRKTEQFTLLDKIKALDALLKKEFLEKDSNSYQDTKTRQIITKLREQLAKTSHELETLNNSLF